MVRFSPLARETRVRIPVRACFFFISKGLLSCSGFELLPSHGTRGRRVESVNKPSAEPNPPSNRFSRINERSFDFSDDCV